MVSSRTRVIWVLRASFPNWRRKLALSRPTACSKQCSSVSRRRPRCLAAINPRVRFPAPRHPTRMIEASIWKTLWFAFVNDLMPEEPTLSGEVIVVTVVVILIALAFALDELQCGFTVSSASSGHGSFQIQAPYSSTCALPLRDQAGVQNHTRLRKRGYLDEEGQILLNIPPFFLFIKKPPRTQRSLRRSIDPDLA